MSRTKLLVLICIVTTGASGFVYAAENDTLSQLPAAVQKVAKHELAGVRITEVDDDDDYDGIDVYKIEAETADGKELMIKVGPDGTLYQKEVEITLEDVPGAVLAVFRKELGNADNDVDEVKRISKQGRIQYNIEADISGRGVELKIAADGTLLEKDVDDDDESSGGVLAGILYDSTDFTNPRKALDVLPSLNMSWGADRGKGWSARWYGDINGPYFGDVTFTAETNGKIRLTIAGYVIIDTLTKNGPLTAVTRMAKDGGDWIQIEFVATESPSYMRIYWQWPGQPKAIVFNDELDYDEDDIPGYGVEDQRRDDEDEKVSPLLPRFTGGQPAVVNLEYHDGRVRPIVGVHNFQVMRSNRTHPELAVKNVPYYPEDGYENIGFMYNHAPMLCYWQDMFWLFYRSGPTKRFRNRSKNNKIQYSIAHQRMAFYVAKDGRLLVSGFYGMPPSPNNGNGVGRAIREVYGPGKYGPIYWVRYNKHQQFNKDNSPHFAFYKEAPDNGFVRAVDELLANNLMVQQWYEEERDDAGRSCAVVPHEDDFDAKGFNWYTLPDGRILGMWKNRWMALADKWQRGHIKVVGMGRNIYYSGAKIWGQRTSDGRYALVYNPVLEGRHPLSVITSDDGLNFNTYGTPPDEAMWLTYSCNKEDIWVSRVPVPITGTIKKDVIDDFEDMRPGGVVTDWNIYSGVWTPIAVVTDKGNKVLRLQDKDPYEYAKAVRVFPEATLTNLSFKLHAHQKGKGDIEIEVLNYKGQRPVRIKIEGGKIKANRGVELADIGTFTAGKWLKFDIAVDTVTGVYDLKLDGRTVVSDAAFAEALTFADKPYESKFRTPTVERIEFRTSAYRMTDFSRYGSGDNCPGRTSR